MNHAYNFFCLGLYWAPTTYVCQIYGQYPRFNAYYDISLGTLFEPYKWYLVEMYIRVSTNRTATDGALEIKLNGTSLTGYLDNISTTNISSLDSLVKTIRFGSTATSSDNYVTLVDDFILCDSTSSFTDAHIIRGEPSAVGSNNYWEPEPPSQETYECVSDIGDQATVETDYMKALGTGGRETFPIAMDTTSSITNVESVQVRSRTRKTGAASAYKVAPVIRAGGTDYDGTSQDLTTDFEEFVEVWEQNPNTLGDWNVSDLNTIEVGVKADE